MLRGPMLHALGRGQAAKAVTLTNSWICVGHGAAARWRDARRRYSSWREEVGVLPDGRHIKQFWVSAAPPAGCGEETGGECGSRRGVLFHIIVMPHAQLSRIGM